MGNEVDTSTYDLDTVKYILQKIQDKYLIMKKILSDLLEYQGTSIKKQPDLELYGKFIEDKLGEYIKHYLESEAMLCDYDIVFSYQINDLHEMKYRKHLMVKQEEFKDIEKNFSILKNKEYHLTIAIRQLDQIFTQLDVQEMRLR
ncbi:hypothetical protein SNEBB_005327 [Seison nebaliae]|nr:hypothetical protein SNEBB_005327 [Seison nebaliae]